jgi:hypothetical protein
MAGYRSWPGPVRMMCLAVDAAVSAARSSEAGAFTDAAAGLSRVDREQLGVLLGAVARDLLERSHPDGLDSDDAGQVLQSCTRSAAGWYEQLDTGSLVQALTGTLGITNPDESPQPGATAVMEHGLLLIADQLTILALELAPVLERALHDLMRAQAIELP